MILGKKYRPVMFAVGASETTLFRALNSVFFA